MHFTSCNLLHDFPNGKYMLFSLYKKINVKNTGQPDPTRNPNDPNPFLTRLKWLVLTCNPFDLTRTARFVMSRCSKVLEVSSSQKLKINQLIKRNTRSQSSL